LVHLIS